MTIFSRLKFSHGIGRDIRSVGREQTSLLITSPKSSPSIQNCQETPLQRYRQTMSLQFNMGVFIRPLVSNIHESSD